MISPEGERRLQTGLRAAPSRRLYTGQPKEPDIEQVRRMEYLRGRMDGLWHEREIVEPVWNADIARLASLVEMATAAALADANSGTPLTSGTLLLLEHVRAEAGRWRPGGTPRVEVQWETIEPLDARFVTVQESYDALVPEGWVIDYHLDWEAGRGLAIALRPV